MHATVDAVELEALADRLPGTLEVLSSDCFDTLLWRDVGAPKDVFAGIGLPGGSIEVRTRAESAARAKAVVRHRRSEVSLEEIYAELYVGADSPALTEAAEGELRLEMAHCRAFVPMLRLLRTMKARGCRIVVVSDTYFSEAQLARLLRSSLGPEDEGLIDVVYTSSSRGKSKAQGLLDLVLRDLSVDPSRVCHVGDNRAADFDAATAAGCSAVHLACFDDAAAKRFRLEAVAATMLDQARRCTFPVLQPYRPIIATRKKGDTAYALGHDVVGPVMTAFACWLAEEIRELAEGGDRVKPLFMMRDGLLPMRAFSALFPSMHVDPIELTRVVATRASLYEDDRIDAFLDEHCGSMPSDALARHLMLSKLEMRSVLERCTGTEGLDLDVHALRSVLSKPRYRALIRERARAFGSRLARHFGKAGVRRGDTVVLVDLGYNGSVQNAVERFLEDRLGLKVAGRYLLLRSLQVRTSDKKGMIDGSNHDMRALHCLSLNVAVLEQLCNFDRGSTIDFDREGEPVFRTASGDKRQEEVRRAAQAGALDFAAAFLRDADHPRHGGTGARSYFAAAPMILARLFAFPTTEEAALFRSFKQDINLGTDRLGSMVDMQASDFGLRTAGLSYINSSNRFFVPAELAGHGLHLGMALFSSSRFSLDLRNSDFDGATTAVPVVLADAERQHTLTVEAVPTHDGYARLFVAIGRGGLITAIQFGHFLEWLQIEDVSFWRAADVGRHNGLRGEQAHHFVEGMSQEGPGLFRAEPGGCLVVPPPRLAAYDLALQIVFRPLARRIDPSLRSLPLAA